jgi:5-methylcytosine-specific restriction endonuclease McrA
MDMNASLGFPRYLVRCSPTLVAQEQTRSESRYRSQATSDDDWAVVHERVVALGRRRAQHEHATCKALLEVERLDIASKCGFASLYEYADRHLGLTRRQTQERLRVGRALRDLPALDQALAEGRLVWSKVRELTRIATPDTSQDWIDHAADRTCRQVADDVAVRSQGDRPTDAGDPSQRTSRLSFDVTPETLALFRELQARVRDDLGEDDADDDALLYEIARRALGGPEEEGRASYQVAVTRCAQCHTTSFDAAGERHVVDETIAAMADCDAQHLGRVDEARHVQQAGSADRPQVRADHSRSTDRPHVGAERATQTIPPATRRAVLRRHGKRCAVPGCRNHRFLDVHHVVPRSEGGAHHSDNLVVLCGAHHRATHRGTLVIEGTAATGLRFEHADGAPYGKPQRAAKTDVAAQAFRGLTNLGFKPTEARRLVQQVQRSGPPEDVAAFLQAALRLV